LAETLSGKVLSRKNSVVNVTLGSKVWITEKPTGDQNATIIPFGDWVIVVGRVGLALAAGSHCCS
jgi:hypothetical protein